MHEMAKSKGTSTHDTKTTPAGGGRTRQPAKPTELPSAEALALSFPPTKLATTGSAQEGHLIRFAELVHQKLKQVPTGELRDIVELHFTANELRGLEHIDSFVLGEMCAAIAKQYPRFMDVSVAFVFENESREKQNPDGSPQLLPSVQELIARLVGKIDKSSNRAGQVSEPLAAYLLEMNVPRKKWREAALALARVVLRFGGPENRPLWDDRAKYPELAFLPAPEFLKRVWADQIGPNGEVDKSLIRQIDRPLIKTVEAYVANRQRRNRDPGQVKGLQLLSRGKAAK
jgi:hypothetical protein